MPGDYTQSAAARPGCPARAAGWFLGFPVSAADLSVPRRRRRLLRRLRRRVVRRLWLAFCAVFCSLGVFACFPGVVYDAAARGAASGRIAVPDADPVSGVRPGSAVVLELYGDVVRGPFPDLAGFPAAWPRSRLDRDGVYYFQHYPVFPGRAVWLVRPGCRTDLLSSGLMHPFSVFRSFRVDYDAPACTPAEAAP